MSQWIKTHWLGVLSVALTAASFIAGLGVDRLVPWPATFSVVGTLPAGLSLNTATGVLSGTPSVSGTFQFGIVAADSSGTPKRVGNRYTLDSPEGGA